MDPLAVPIEINGVRIRNRLVRSATMENMADEQGMVTPQYCDLYEQLSVGGVGLIITGHMYVDSNGRTNEGMAGVTTDECIPLLRTVTDTVHIHGAAIFAQLNHAGLKAFPEKHLEKHIVSPSKTRNSEALSVDEIQEIVHAFGRGAARIKKAGFDGIQIHGAHAYLIEQFLARALNHRKDQYGGSLSNRQRFCLEIYQRIRDEVGNEYPVIIKLDSYSHSYASMPPLVPLISLEESLHTAHRLAEAGIDGIEVSAGFHATRGAMPYKAGMRTMLLVEGKPLQAAAASALWTPLDLILNRRFWFKPNHNINHIRIFKQQLNVPILGGSCFRDPSYMRHVIENREADMMCMCRPFVIDPEFPNKILSNSTTPSRCINCNLCMMMLPSGFPLQCYYGKPLMIDHHKEKEEK